MTIEPKLLSVEDLAWHAQGDHMVGYGDVVALLAHIAALDQQVSAKDAEIERLKAGIEQFRKLQEQISKPYESDRLIIRGDANTKIKDIPMDKLRNEIYDVVRTIASHKDAEWVRGRLLDAGWTKPSVTQQVEPAAHNGLDELAAIEAWLDDQGAPHVGDLNTEPTPISTLGRIQWLIDHAVLSTQQPPSEAAPELRHEVLAFARLMEAQLKANDHKPGWKNDRPDDLLARLYDEVEEVRDNLDFWRNSYPDRVSLGRAIGNEAADVANFAMMIADVCGALGLVKPVNMLVDANWLREKVAADPDIDCEVGLTEDEAAERGDPDRSGGRLHYHNRLQVWTKQRDEAAPAVQEQELRERLEIAFRRFGGVNAIARSADAKTKLIDIVCNEVAALRTQGGE